MSKQGKIPDVPASGTSNEHLVLGLGDSSDSSRSIIEAEARLRKARLELEDVQLCRSQLLFQKIERLTKCDCEPQRMRLNIKKRERNLRSRIRTIFKRLLHTISHTDE